MPHKKSKGIGVRALVVDDEPAIRRFLTSSLITHGYIVSDVGKGMLAVDALTSVRPDVIILDLGLPDIDGVTVTRMIRKRTSTPIIILSVNEEEEKKIAALDAGADDYLTKPFSVGELLARLRAVLRRAVQEGGEPILKIGRLLIDLERRLVEVEGRPVHLTPTEYDILKVLALHRGKVITHSQLLKQVWKKDDDYEGISHLLRVTVSNLRSKIEPDDSRPTYIVTEPGVGYRLLSDH